MSNYLIKIKEVKIKTYKFDDNGTIITRYYPMWKKWYHLKWKYIWSRDTSSYGAIYDLNPPETLRTCISDPCIKSELEIMRRKYTPFYTGDFKISLQMAKQFIEKIKKAEQMLEDDKQYLKVSWSKTYKF